MTRRILEQTPFLVLAALCLGTALLTDRFLSPVNIGNVMLQASVMAVVAMGMTYVIISGGFDISVGSTVAAAGCAAASVMLEWGTGAGAVAGVAVGVLVGALNGGEIAALQIPDRSLGTRYVVRIDQVADAATFALLDPAQWSATLVTRP